jgi:hypothetical protein
MLWLASLVLHRRMLQMLVVAFCALHAVLVNILDQQVDCLDNHLDHCQQLGAGKKHSNRKEEWAG